MPPLTGLLVAAVLLLAGAGWLKLRRPADTAQALRTQGLPSATWLVRALGAVELAAAAAVLAGAGAPAAAAVAVLYAGFTGFVLLALVRDRPLSSCGCFARPDTPPSWWHVTVTGALAAASAAAAAGPPVVLADASAATVAGALAAGGVVAATAYAVLAELPPVLAAAARRAEAPEVQHPALFHITRSASS
ncbi:MAG: MauE/DoxX family redox-associated membrane protein [Actinomycetes bacterium]